jgi:hypothetical protein
VPGTREKRVNRVVSGVLLALVGYVAALPQPRWTYEAFISAAALARHI